jgi:hypothetical protein
VLGLVPGGGAGLPALEGPAGSRPAGERRGGGAKGAEGRGGEGAGGFRGARAEGGPVPGPDGDDGVMGGEEGCGCRGESERSHVVPCVARPSKVSRGCG